MNSPSLESSLRDALPSFSLLRKRVKEAVSVYGRDVVIETLENLRSDGVDDEVVLNTLDCLAGWCSAEGRIQ